VKVPRAWLQSANDLLPAKGRAPRLAVGHR
jgi:hypothetical protein